MSMKKTESMSATKYSWTAANSGRFYDTIGYVTRAVERDEKLDKNIVVRSASGDISLNMVMSEGMKMCMMTQEKELLTMGHRRQTIGFLCHGVVGFFLT